MSERDSPAMASTMQLEFSQAMNDFKNMFPDMDDDVIEAVLRANQGAVDSTIDQLLAMSTDYQNEQIRHELELVEGETPRRKGTLQHKKKTEVAPASSSLVETTSASPLSIKHKWKPKLLGPLPPMFLRIPPSESRIDLSLDMDDEKIAAFLQNEEFMAELRWNQDFIAALDSDQGKDKGHEDETDFKERLKNMGKLSRKKFAQISRVFTRGGSRKASGAKPPVKVPPESLLLQEEHSDDDDRPQTSKETK